MHRHADIYICRYDDVANVSYQRNSTNISNIFSLQPLHDVT